MGYPLPLYWIFMQFKYPRDYTLSLCMHPLAVMILGYASFTAQQMDLPFVVTSTVSDIREDERLGRTSASHREGRAFDISIYGWTTDDIDNFKFEMERKFGDLGAWTHRGEQRLVVVHNGTAPHIHVQISREFRDEVVFPYLSSSTR